MHTADLDTVPQMYSYSLAVSKMQGLRWRESSCSYTQCSTQRQVLQAASVENFQIELLLSCIFPSKHHWLW